MKIGALSGIRVIDLSRLLPGPYCSMMLADLGAEVIKVEEPGRGDYLRHFPPKVKEDSAFFLSINRNKKSITLNLKDERGKKIILDLIKKADVLLEGFRPGVMEKMGLGYDVIRKINPALIVCSISGYGQNGPYSMRSGHDVNYLALGGATGVTRNRNGRPVLMGVQIADIGGGAMLAAFCILAALIAREKIGKGQYIDISMMDGVLPWMCLSMGKYFASGEEPEYSREILTGKYACYNIYKTKDDQYMSLGAVEPQFWSEFCKSIDRDDLIKYQYDVELADKMISELRDIFNRKTKHEWIEHFSSRDCMCEPVNNIDEVVSDKQVLYRRMITEIAHPTEGILKMISFPGKLSETPAEIKMPPPVLGQHNHEILKEMNISEAEIAALKRDKVI